MQCMQGSVGKLVLEVNDDPLYVALWLSITRNQAHTPLEITEEGSRDPPALPTEAVPTQLAA